MSKIVPQSNEWSTTVLPEPAQEEKERFRWLRWWYHLTAPAPPPYDASYEQQEAYRRARLASIIMGVVCIFGAAGLLVAPFFGFTVGFARLAVVEVLMILALWLNRVGKLVISGLLFIGIYTIGIMASYLLAPEGLDMAKIIGYDMLFIGILLAVAFFPPWTVFVVALGNCLFIWLDFTYQAHDAMVEDFIVNHGAHVAIERTIGLQVVVATVLYLLVQSANKALRRADRAEVIAKLQHDLTERDRTQVSEKNQLEYSIEQIVGALTAYSNGDFTARVPLKQDNVLWHIGGSVNNLLARVQRLRHAEQELDRIRPVLMRARHLEHENAALRAALQRKMSDKPQE